MNGSIGEWFRTPVGVRQECLLSPTLFNIFLERIMSDALKEYDGKVIIGGRNITNLRFADDIDALAEEEQEFEALVESFDKTCTRYKMEISAEKVTHTIMQYYFTNLSLNLYLNLIKQYAYMHNNSDAGRNCLLLLDVFAKYSILLLVVSLNFNPFG